LPFAWNPELLPAWGLALAVISTFLLIAIPAATLLYAIGRALFNFKSMSSPVKWTMAILWILSLGATVFCAVHFGVFFFGEYFWD
jgi:hypothetical protein